MNVLVVGGAGYIGSHMIRRLREESIDLVVLDDFSTGRRAAVRGFELVEGRSDDRLLLDSLFRTRSITAVMHFGAFIEVGESVRDPAKYYRNNLSATQHLLDSMVAHGVKSLIFSSTAAIYGAPRYTPIDENHPKEPASPYGRTKWMVEQMLQDYDRAYGLKSICLRYFNAAGADPQGRTGECHDPETHLIPIVLQVASGRRESIAILGDDYETSDGTCVRDYVHVVDLCAAHLAALRNLSEHAESGQFNLGNGRGFSVREVIATVVRVTGRPVTTRPEARRPGDTPIIVANSDRARTQLGWLPQRGNLEDIVRDAWNWERCHFLAGTL